MNERIEKLKHQASLWCDMNIPDQFGEYGYGEVWEDKFAELIVKECAEVVQEGRWMVPPSQEQLARSIKQHFGVEE